MSIFSKFEFLPSEWEALKPTIQIPNEQGEPSWNNCAVHEIGFICKEWDNTGEFSTCKVQSDKWAVDILWYGEQPEAFNPSQVWPTPCGVHVFSGYEAQYAKDFCAKFPDSPYCVIPETPKL
jgi:hypothetical protein